MYVTRPEDMAIDLSIVEEVINKFETEIAELSKGEDAYTVSIKGYYPSNVRQKVVEIYKNAGWKSVSCKGFSDVNVEDGFTSLYLSSTHSQEKVYRSQS